MKEHEKSNSTMPLGMRLFFSFLLCISILPMVILPFYFAFSKRPYSDTRGREIEFSEDRAVVDEEYLQQLDSFLQAICDDPELTTRHGSLAVRHTTEREILATYRRMDDPNIRKQAYEEQVIIQISKADGTPIINHKVERLEMNPDFTEPTGTTLLRKRLRYEVQAGFLVVLNELLDPLPQTEQESAIARSIIWLGQQGDHSVWDSWEGFRDRYNSALTRLITSKDLLVNIAVESVGMNPGLQAVLRLESDSDLLDVIELAKNPDLKGIAIGEYGWTRYRPYSAIAGLLCPFSVTALFLWGIVWFIRNG